MDEIVDFAQRREYGYDRIRIYSRGIYRRVRCSVAVPVAPEILLIDEVLAVGDATFTIQAHVAELGPEPGKRALINQTLSVTYGYPLKVVFSAEGSRIVVITAYPLRKGRGL